MIQTGIAANDRIAAVRHLLGEEDVQAIIVAPSSDLRYLTGAGGHASERPTLLIVPARGETMMLVPRLEAPRLARDETIRLLVWSETDDPYQVLATSVAFPGDGSVAISDQAWAAVLLGLQRSFPTARFVAASPLLRRLRMLKSDDELAALAKAANLADEAFQEVMADRFSGRSERDLASRLASMLQERGLEIGWGPSVSSGPNTASPHHLTGDRVVEEGDAVMLDFGGALDGYQADITRTVHVGPAPADFVRVYEVVRRAQQAGVDAVRPGVAAQDVDSAARSVIEGDGYGEYFTHRTGHGIGLDTHEEPYIVSGNTLELEPGMTFSVEPGVYLPGRFGVRIEDIVAVTDGGVRRLNEAPRELQIVR
ncbi:MAG TPA: Xaa-Pro peptidase family protein [Chloroflexota bacterium]|nr:Xaa-Pro peptidase family protein [Chloroflexota bacterium]